METNRKSTYVDAYKQWASLPKEIQQQIFQLLLNVDDKEFHPTKTVDTDDNSTMQTEGSD